MGIIPGTEHVPARATVAALNGECVDLADFVNDGAIDINEFKSYVDTYGNINFKCQSSKPVISNMSKWLEAWTVYELVLVGAFGVSIFFELARYRAFILGLFQKFKLPQVLVYDLRHRQRLASFKSLSFASVDHDLYVTIFDSNSVRTGGVKCNICNANDHTAAKCPFRIAGQPHEASRGAPAKKREPEVAKEICVLFQDNRCRFGEKCRRRHVCYLCQGPEPAKTCTACRTNKSSSPR
jgi:hypothetical protein